MKGSTLEPKAAIWDLDGVIADTAQLHFRAWRRLAGELGRTLTYEEFLPTFGRRNAEIAGKLLPPTLTPDQVAKLTERKERYFRELIGPDFQAAPGVVKLVQQLHEHGYRQAIASSAPLANVKLILKRLHLAHCFSAVVSSEDATLGKPDPQVFLLAAWRLRVSPSRSVVFEDSVAGVEAARAAGMAVIAIANSWPREALHEADIIVASLEEVTVSTLDSLIDRHRRTEASR